MQPLPPLPSVTKRPHGFAPGVVQHRNGQTARMPREVREHLHLSTMNAAKAMTDALRADRTLVLGKGKDARTVEVPDWPVRLAAAAAIFDRLYGRPKQALDLDVSTPNEPPRVRLEDLSDEELTALETLKRAQERLRER